MVHSDNQHACSDRQSRIWIGPYDLTRGVVAWWCLDDDANFQIRVVGDALKELIMGEVYNGYLIIGGPNDAGYLIRYPAVDPVTLAPGGVVGHEATKQAGRDWVDAQLVARREAKR